MANAVNGRIVVEIDFNARSESAFNTASATINELAASMAETASEATGIEFNSVVAYTTRKTVVSGEIAAPAVSAADEVEAEEAPKKRRGRPPGSGKKGSKKAGKKAAASPTGKRRGRPPGSKNKPKPDAVLAAAPKKKGSKAVLGKKSSKKAGNKKGGRR